VRENRNNPMIPHDDDPLKKAQDKYEKTEKGKARRKKYEAKPEVQERRKSCVRDRAEYMREYRRKKKEEQEN
jgi:hypothetical protein